MYDGHVLILGWKSLQSVVTNESNLPLEIWDYYDQDIIIELNGTDFKVLDRDYLVNIIT